MALLFVESFDHYATALSPVGMATKWGTLTNNPQTIATGGIPRTGTQCCNIGGAATLTTKALPASGGCVAGWAAWQAGGTATYTGDLLEVREGATVHMAVACDTSVAGATHLQVKRGSTVLATGTTVLPVAGYVFIEFKCVIHATAGSYELRLDGATELSASGINTRNGGTTGQWDRVLFGGTGSTGSIFYVDDIYVCDLSGPRNNDFLGPCKVELLMPQTDAVAAGSNAGLTPSTGTDHGALVDEVGPNTTDYNSSPTVGAKDTYNYPSTTLTGAILGIQTNLYVAKSDSAARQVCAVVRTSGTDYDGASISPGTSFSYFSEVREINPATGLAWTTADVNALEAGMKVTA